MDGDGAVSVEPNRDACREWRGDLAMRGLGRPDPQRAAGLQAHLDGCPSCRAELDDLEGVAQALLLADPDHLSVAAAAPAGLSARILGAVSADASRARRRRRLTATFLAAAAALIVIASAGLILRDDSAPTSARSVELVGDAAMGHAELVERAWGTEVAFEATGLRADTVYWLWLTGDDGERVAAGTIIGTGDRIEAVMGAALPTDETRRIWVTDEDDEIVLDAVLERA